MSEESRADQGREVERAEFEVEELDGGTLDDVAGGVEEPIESCGGGCGAVLG